MKKPWWWWIAVPAGVLLALIGVCWGIGALLPRTHAVTRTAVFRQPLDTVWATVADMEHSPSWRSDITGVRRLEDRNGHEVWLQLAKEGNWPLEIAVSEPPIRIVAVVADSSQGFGGRWTYEFAAESGGTRLTITERGFVDMPLFRFMANFIFGLNGALETYLKDLGRKFGETVTPAPARLVG
jgi:uncharacterized protein YndB with AHSA1/START domain